MNINAIYRMLYLYENMTPEFAGACMARALNIMLYYKGQHSNLFYGCHTIL